MAGFLGLGSGEGAFFLEPDDAKSFGDIDYMRTAKTVKKTFAKSKGWGDIGNSEKSISAYDERGDVPVSGYSTPRSSAYSAPATPQPYTSPAVQPAAPVSEPAASVSESVPVSEPAASSASESTPAPAPAPTPASSDDGMDMFRSMARKIR